jgi:hypothetical protein
MNPILKSFVNHSLRNLLNSLTVWMILVFINSSDDFSKKNVKLPSLQKTVYLALSNLLKERTSRYTFLLPNLLQIQLGTTQIGPRTNSRKARFYNNLILRNIQSVAKLLLYRLIKTCLPINGKT